MTTPLGSPAPHWSFLRLERELDRFRGEPPAGIRDRQLERVLRHIHRDPFAPELNVQAVKRACGIRDNNISSRFRFHLGRTIRAYIEGLRLEAARHLLRESPTGIFDIALSVGFLHPQTFYNAFRRSHRCTPAEYRRRERCTAGPPDPAKSGSPRRGAFSSNYF